MHGLNRLLHQLLGACAEGKIHPALRAEQIGGNGESAAFHIGEQKRGTSLIDDTAVDFRQLQIGVHLSVDYGNILFFLQNLNELPQILKHHGQGPPCWLCIQPLYRLLGDEANFQPAPSDPAALAANQKACLRKKGDRQLLVNVTDTGDGISAKSVIWPTLRTEVPLLGGNRRV
jgi:hypothetical protein